MTTDGHRDRYWAGVLFVSIVVVGLSIVATVDVLVFGQSPAFLAAIVFGGVVGVALPAALFHPLIWDRRQA